MKFKSLDDAQMCYGKSALIAISNLKQILAYSRFGCQPVYICEKEDRPEHLTCWYLKPETAYAKKKWEETRPIKTEYGTK